MTSKREERRQRAEAGRLDQERRRRQRVLKSRALVVAGALALLAISFMAARRPRGESAGRVWSPEHGHWHEK